MARYRIGATTARERTFSAPHVRLHPLGTAHSSVRRTRICRNRTGELYRFHRLVADCIATTWYRRTQTSDSSGMPRDCDQEVQTMEPQNGDAKRKPEPVRLSLKEMNLRKQKAANLDEALEWLRGRMDSEPLITLEAILRRGLPPRRRRRDRRSQAKHCRCGWGTPADVERRRVDRCSAEWRALQPGCDPQGARSRGPSLSHNVRHGDPSASVSPRRRPRPGEPERHFRTGHLGRRPAPGRPCS